MQVVLDNVSFAAEDVNLNYVERASDVHVGHVGFGSPCVLLVVKLGGLLPHLAQNVVGFLFKCCCAPLGLIGREDVDHIIYVFGGLGSCSSVGRGFRTRNVS